jgi:GNAT superfamily N-acetyltransferase
VNSTPLSIEGVQFREGRAADLRPTFELSRTALHRMAEALAVDDGGPAGAEDLERDWRRRRPLLEFVSAQEGSFVISEHEGRPVGFARTCRFGDMEELTDFHVLPSHSGRGIGPALLERCWPDPPTPDLGRVAVGPGVSRVLNALTDAGVMPSAGHWHMRARATEYLERRSRVIDATEPAVVVLGRDRAVAEWARLEPGAIGHARPAVHEFFARTRTCLAAVDEATGHATSLCWVGGEDEVGPAVGASSQDLVPVVLQALDRVARTQEPETLDVYCATHSWWLLRRLRSLGFGVYWPIWVMSSVPLPGLDRYLPTRPAHLL